jgi:hypothetical protein
MRACQEMTDHTQTEIYIKYKEKKEKETSLTLKAAPPRESPSSLVSMAPVMPISILNVVTNAKRQ